MSNPILLVISMSAALVGGMLKKLLTDRFENSTRAYQLYNAIVSIVAAVCLFVVSTNMSASTFTILLALLFGLVTLIQQITNMQALEVGPFSYTSVIISLSTLIPTLSGVIIWNETISFVQIIGIVLMVACIILSVDFKSNQKKASLKWLGYCAAAFICTGFIGVMQKWHQNSAYKGELDAFLVIAFLFSFLTSTVFFIVQSIRRKKTTVHQNEQKEGTAVINKKSVIAFLPILIMVISGICVAANNKLNLFLSGAMPSAVFFPIVNGGGLVLSLLAVIVLFKERLSLKQWIGVILGIISVVLLCNPF
ncbi:MAG: hypothetical protein E7315_01100 [Clostridiales bacterium]|nr:hypothetical protein [Clostridiales bacterium]